mgnify:CR=1 FL=1|jgi:hypothetical protein|tara:strand:- start:358 stop:711 length:354 start_codon:yes stop_codon:yes gene_type:complete
MAFEESIILFYVSIIFVLFYASFKLKEDVVEHFILKLLFLGVAFLMMLNGVTTTHAILDAQNYTSDVLNETVYASISTKLDNSYNTILWTFIFSFAWIGIMIFWIGRKFTNLGNKNG